MQRFWLGLGAVLVVCSGSSCCTVFVGDKMKDLGYTQWIFDGSHASSDQEGNLVVEGEFTAKGAYRSGRPSKVRQKLGRRYLILRAPQAQAQVRRALGTWPKERERGELRVSGDGTPLLSVGCFACSFPADEAAAPQAEGWFLWPVDFARTLERPALPSFIRPDGLVRGPLSGLPYELDGKAYTLGIGVWLFHDDWPRNIDRPANALREHVAGWAGPVKILVYIPCVAVDIVTFPVSIVWGLSLGPGFAH